MKDNWERMNPVSRLSHSEINEMARSYFRRDVVNFTLVSGGLSNSNFQIHIKDIDNPYLLRVYRNSDQACQKEWDIYRLVHQTVPVPEVYYIDSSCKVHERPFAIMEVD